MRVNRVTATRHELSKRHANSDCAGKQQRRGCRDAFNMLFLWVSENSAGAEKADAGYDRLDYTDRIRLYQVGVGTWVEPLNQGIAQAHEQRRRSCH
jgi:hypothetical protein